MTLAEIEDASGLALHAIAAGTLEDANRHAGDLPVPALERFLVDRAVTTYARNPRFARRMRSRAGRDHVYAFMRHWLAAKLKLSYPCAFASLPADWGVAP